MTGVLLFSVLLLAWSSASSPEQWTSCRESSSPHRSTLFQENVCNLHFIADPTLWRHYKYERFGTELTDEKTSEKIETFFAGHVSALKRIFRDTEFTTYDGRESWRGIDFELDRSTIMTDMTQKCYSPEASAFCFELDVDKYRYEIFTMNHEEYCLAVFFNFRHFFSEQVSETLLATPFQTGAGICDLPVEVATEYGIKVAYCNVIWVSLTTTIRTLTEKATHIFLAHEVGHALGSPHDDGPDCVPGANSPAGNYLMSEAINDNKENNEKLSICSKDNITRLLSSVVYSRHGRRNCLKPSISGRGLIHRFVQPDISSGNEKDPEFHKHGRNTQHEL